MICYLLLTNNFKIQVNFEKIEKKKKKKPFFKTVEIYRWFQMFDQGLNILI